MCKTALVIGTILLITFIVLAVFFALGFIVHFQEAYATNYRPLYDQASCESLPVSGGSAVWGGSKCTINGGVLLINAPDNLYVLYGTLVVSESSSLKNYGHLGLERGQISNFGNITNENAISMGDEASISNSGTIQNNGQIAGDMMGISNSGQINNNGTISVNRGSLANAVGGSITNNGTIEATESTTIVNDATIVNNNLIDNFGNEIINKRNLDNNGLIKNRSHFINFGMVNNTNGSIINSYSLFENKCGGILIGTLSGDPPVVTSCFYHLDLFEDNSGSDSIISVGQQVNLNADTDDFSVNQVTFRWIDPTGHVEREVTNPVASSSISRARDDFFPQKNGAWIVEADFMNGVVMQKELNVSFFVIPESPVGSMAMVAVSISALGGFMYFRQYRNKGIE